jgi:hypothetical protein
MRARIQRLGFATVSLVMLACGASSPPSASDRMDSAELALRIHAERVGVIYEYARLLERLSDGGGGAVRETFHESDIARYVVGPEPSGTVAFHLTPAASTRWRGAVPAVAETQPFVVSLRERMLYAGVVYPAIGAAAIESPVVHAGKQRGNVVLTIGAFQGAAFLQGSPELARRIDRAELRELFRRRGALREASERPSPLERER